MKFDLDQHIDLYKAIKPLVAAVYCRQPTEQVQENLALSGVAVTPISWNNGIVITQNIHSHVALVFSCPQSLYLGKNVAFYPLIETDEATLYVKLTTRGERGFDFLSPGAMPEFSAVEIQASRPYTRFPVRPK